MVDIRKLIGAISPDIYCKSDVRKEVKEIAKKEGYVKAAEKVEFIDQDILFETDFSRESVKAPKPLDAPGLKSPVEMHKLTYDSPAEGLEPVYFWILDFIQDIGYKTEKIVDNFVSAPGSAHFSEIGLKAQGMQNAATKALGDINTVLKSVLNIIYDLREFKIRLDAYNLYHSEKKSDKEAALLSLKQIWLDRVDINRGNTSIKAMAQQFDYVTLIDAFMAARSIDDVSNKPEEGGLDLNERVRRILQQRLSEFFTWIDQSEKELRKRYEIEKNYLKSQVNALKLYIRWVKPYLKSAHQLEQRASPTAGLVTTFNSMILELVLLGQNEYKPSDDVAVGDLPEMFKNITEKKYYSIVIIELNFRGIPTRSGQGFSYGGRVDAKFTGLALNDSELKVLKQEIEKDDFGEVLKLIQGATDDSLSQIQKDIDEFLEEGKDKKEEEEKNKESNEDTNPFTALFSFFKSDKKKDKDKKKDGKIELTPDNRYEKILRSQAIISARDGARNVFETYKKGHQMPSF